MQSQTGPRSAPATLVQAAGILNAHLGYTPAGPGRRLRTETPRHIGRPGHCHGHAVRTGDGGPTGDGLRGRSRPALADPAPGLGHSRVWMEAPFPAPVLCRRGAGCWQHTAAPTVASVCIDTVVARPPVRERRDGAVLDTRDCSRGSHGHRSWRHCWLSKDAREDNLVTSVKPHPWPHPSDGVGGPPRRWPRPPSE